MGITHHEQAVATVQTIVKFPAFQGNLGRLGRGRFRFAAIPTYRAMGRWGRPARCRRISLNRLEAVFGVPVQRKSGRTPLAARGLLAGEIRGFRAGREFRVAIPDGPRVRQAPGRVRSDLSVATKLNRTHLHPGRLGLLPPALGRTDRDRDEVVTAEDSMRV